MKASVDRAICQGHARCAVHAPEVFRLDGEGYSFVDNEVVPAGLEAAVRRAAASCPELAITVSEDAG